MIRSLIIAFLLALSLFTGAEACSYAPPPSSPREAHDSAVAFYEDVEFAYEGMVLGPHHFDRGGRFLVLRSYKGPARPLDVLTLPPGNSCYRGLSVFGVWAGNDPAAGIAELVPRETLGYWRREGFISGSVLPAAAGGVLAGFLILAALVWHRRRQRRGRRRS